MCSDRLGHIATAPLAAFYLSGRYHAWGWSIGTNARHAHGGLAGRDLWVRCML